MLKQYHWRTFVDFDAFVFMVCHNKYDLSGDVYMSIRGLSCIFPASDIKKTAEFYETKLGFEAVSCLECEEPHICLYRDGVEIILLQANTNTIMPNHILYGYGYDAYLYTEYQEDLEREFMQKDVKFVKHLNITDYNNKEFVIEDTDGRRLAFGLKIKE